jgi:3-oxoacyl-(acyl-carrier-protein) synthase
VIRAAEWIRRGECELALAGSTDAALHPLWFGAFQRMGVLARRHPDYGFAWSCRPFDRLRTGFAMGEGAAVLLLESGRSARSRQVGTIARLAGWACGSDPAGLIRSHPDGMGLGHVLKQACNRSCFEPQELAAIYAHGTGTRTNDLLEARAFAHLLGRNLHTTPVLSLKGALGHLLGAAGAVELATAALACKYGLSPGNITLVEPDPELGHLQLPQKTFELRPGPILKVSLGFGGHQAALLLSPG